MAARPQEIRPHIKYVFAALGSFPERRTKKRFRQWGSSMKEKFYRLKHGTCHRWEAHRSFDALHNRRKNKPPRYHEPFRRIWDKT